MANERLVRGTVKWFDVRKGFGFISDEGWGGLLCAFYQY